MKRINIVGARPNFIKIALLMKEMQKRAGIDPMLVHTGQHYDVSMAGQFFEDLQIPPPDVSLEVGSGSHAYQTGEVMKRLEPLLERERPDVVVVVGDVNSTLAAALTAAKLQIPVAHVEAGSKELIQDGHHLQGFSTCRRSVSDLANTQAQAAVRGGQRVC